MVSLSLDQLTRTTNGQGTSLSEAQVVLASFIGLNRLDSISLDKGSSL